MPNPWLTVGTALTGGLGAIADWFQGMEDRNYIKEQTEISDQRLQAAGGDVQSVLAGILPNLKRGYGAAEHQAINAGNRLLGNVTSGWQNLSDSATSFYDQGAAGITSGQGARISSLGRAMSDLTGDYEATGRGIISGYEGRTKQAMGYVDRMGQSQRRNILEGADATRGRVRTSLAGSGMGSTGVGAVMERGINRDTDKSLEDLEDALLGRQLDTYGKFSGETLAAREGQQAGVAGLRTTGASMLDTARGQSLTQQQQMLDTRSNLQSMLGAGKLESLANLGRWNASQAYDARMANLGQQMALDMMPSQTAYDQVRDQISTRMNWGLPPSVASPFTSFSQILANMRNASEASSAASSGSGGALVGSGISGGASIASSALLGSILKSDRRLKENIADLDYGLEQVEQLRPVTWDWIAEVGVEDQNAGLIAQEVLTVIPEAVHELEDGTMCLNYGPIVATLINAVRELSERVLELEEAQAAQE